MPDINWDWLNYLPPAEQAFVNMSQPKGTDRSSQRIWDDRSQKWTPWKLATISPNVTVTLQKSKAGETYTVTSLGGTVEIKIEGHPWRKTIDAIDEILRQPKLHYTLPPRISTRRKHLGQIALALTLASWVLYAVFTFGR